MTDHKPGHEFDALIAEKVMGFAKGTECHSPRSFVGGEFPCGFCHFCTDPDPYSTDISPAMEVWDKLKELEPFQLRLEWFKDTGYRARLWTENGDFHDGEHEDKAMAICLMALRAVGE